MIRTSCKPPTGCGSRTPLTPWSHAPHHMARPYMLLLPGNTGGSSLYGYLEPLVRAGGYDITSRGPMRLLGNDVGPPWQIDYARQRLFPLFKGSGTLATAIASWDNHRNRCKIRVIRGCRTEREDAEASGDLSTAHASWDDDQSRAHPRGHSISVHRPSGSPLPSAEYWNCQHLGCIRKTFITFLDIYF